MGARAQAGGGVCVARARQGGPDTRGALRSRRAGGSSAALVSPPSAASGTLPTPHPPVPLSPPFGSPLRRYPPQPPGPRGEEIQGAGSDSNGRGASAPRPSEPAARWARPTAAAAAGGGSVRGGPESGWTETARGGPPRVGARCGSLGSGDSRGGAATARESEEGGQRREDFGRRFGPMAKAPCRIRDEGSIPRAVSLACPLPQQDLDRLGPSWRSSSHGTSHGRLLIS